MRTRFCLKTLLLPALVLALLLCLGGAAWAAASPNGLTVSAVGDTWLSAPWGEPLTLSVNASCNEGGLSYQWFRVSYPDNYNEVYAPISGAVTPTLSMSRATEGGAYVCRVTDDFGNSREVSFHVSLDNGLTARAVSRTVLLAEPGEAVSFQVEASCEHGSLHYSWRSEMSYGLTAADAPTFTMTASGRDWISCIVSDECGNSTWVDFTLEVKTGLWAVPVADEYYKMYAVIRPPYGESAVLKVEAGSDAGPVSYRWRSDNLGELEGSGPVYTTAPIIENDSYYCTVGDGTGKTWQVRFEVSPGEPPIPELTLGVEMPVDITEDGQVRDFLFTPAETGGYRIFSTGDRDTVGELYDTDGELVQRNDDGGENRNFLITDTLTAGETYKLGARLYSGTGSFAVCVQRDTGLTLKPVGSNVRSILPGEDAVMAVSASVDFGDVSYAWYEEDDGTGRTVVAGQTGPSCTIRGLSSPAQYVCVVTDSLGHSREIIFWVSINSGLQAWAADGNMDIQVPYGESATLRVAAQCDYGGLHYRWFDAGIDVQAPPSDTVYTTQAITTQQNYTCQVSDDYGNTRNVYFIVSVDNALTVDPDGSKQIEVYVPLGESAELEVRASCREGRLHYSWSGSSEEVMESGTVTRYTTGPVQYRGYYYCNIWDDFGNSRSIGFTVYVDNGFSAEAAGGSKITVPLNGSAVLRVNASCRSGELHYHWYAWSNSDPSFEDSAADTLTLKNVTQTSSYVCEVSDDYGNSKEIDFTVNIDNAFSAEPVGKTYVCAQRGDTVTFRVKASCRSGELKYVWYAFNSAPNDNPFQVVGNANDPVLTVNLSARLQPYICFVSDEFGNSSIIQFAALGPDIMLPEGLKRVESEAFAGMPWLLVWAPPSVTEIAPDAFDPSTLVIGEPGSYAYEFGTSRQVNAFPFLE